MTKDMLEKINFRPARKEDSRIITHLYSIASDGVTDYILQKECEPGQDPLEVGAARYSEDDNPFGYKSCTLAESDGKVLGMLLAFPMHKNENPEENLEIDPILEPFMKLEQYESFFICAMAVFEQYREQGIGTKFLDIAEDKAKELGLSQMSLLVFDQNEGAKKLYEHTGYYEIDREPVVPNELIQQTGYVLLMVKDL